MGMILGVDEGTIWPITKTAQFAPVTLEQFCPEKTGAVSMVTALLMTNGVSSRYMPGLSFKTFASPSFVRHSVIAGVASWPLFLTRSIDLQVCGLAGPLAPLSIPIVATISKNNFILIIFPSDTFFDRGFDINSSKMASSIDALPLSIAI
jgi:hypothetical protein